MMGTVQPSTPLHQVMALVMAPFLLEDPRVNDMFPGDAIARAREYLVHVKGGIGAYSDSKGNQYIRQEVRACKRVRCTCLRLCPASGGFAYDVVTFSHVPPAATRVRV